MRVKVSLYIRWVLDLSSSVVTHGKLYVTLCRATACNDFHPERKTPRVVFSQVIV
jgi:hypothetical protein